MNTGLSENIRLLRRSQKITQQQLADAMSVTVGAVHKWEQGLSMPDIRVIMDLAAYFGLSVDALVGYPMDTRDRSQILAQLKKIRLEKKVSDCRDRIEGWLRRYPNDFDIVYESGVLFHLAGMEARDPDLLQRAVDLLTRAGNLLPDRSEVTVTEIYQRIGLTCLDLGRQQEGLDHLRAHNPCGIHNDTIGMELAQDPDRAAEARAVLSRAMLQCTLSLHRTGWGFLTLFLNRGEYREALALLDLLISFEAAQELPDCPGFVTKDRAVFLGVRAALELQTGSRDRAAETLEAALSAADSFDAAPDYSSHKLRFSRYMDPVTTFETSGPTAREAVAAGLRDLQDLGKPALALWQEVCHEV